VHVAWTRCARGAAALAMVFLFSGAALPRTIWTDKNIYSSGESLQVGDIVSVNIDDISQMRFSITLTDSSTFNISSTPDASVTGFLPRVNADKKINNNDKTEVSGRGNLKVVIGSRVTRKLPDGKFEIGGDREYVFNGVSSRFTVAGIIDPSSVKGRSVFSKDIANFRLSIRGTKEAAGIAVTRPPLKENETAGVTLTEEEKQRIIVDYLNKILRELTR
jgi:flagellar basal body L-ring protein FlgH